MEEKIDDIKHGAYGYVVGISKIRAVYIIPESPES